jgi:hypothetical protein
MSYIFAASVPILGRCFVAFAIVDGLKMAAKLRREARSLLALARAPTLRTGTSCMCSLSTDFDNNCGAVDCVKVLVATGLLTLISSTLSCKWGCSGKPDFFPFIRGCHDKQTN